MTRDADQLFVYVLAIRMSSWEKCFYIALESKWLVTYPEATEPQADKVIWCGLWLMGVDTLSGRGSTNAALWFHPPQISLIFRK